jgi:ABC-type lipoprotein release transport system permease subunit
MLWKLAWRNLWRQRGRTLVLGTAVALSCALMLVAFGINDDGHTRMLREAANAAGGDVLVHAEEYWESRSTDLVVRDAERVRAVMEGVEGVRVAIPRILVQGLASTSVDSRPVYLQGIDLALEMEMRDLTRHLREGSFLAGDERAAIVVGARLAERLEVGIGERVVLTGTTPEGEVTRALFHVAGVTESGVRELDEVTAYTTLAAAQRAFGMAGAVTQIGVVAGERVEARELAARLSAALAGHGGLEVLAWQEAVPEMVALIEIDDAMDTIILAIIYVIVLFSIANTFMMAVMERVREFGLLNALGLRSGRIGRLLLGETLLLTAMALAAGLLLGFAGHLAVSHWGINTAAMGMQDVEMAGVDLADFVIYSTIVPARWIGGTLFIGLATIAAALYPAWRATRLAPAEAMRFYE